MELYFCSDGHSWAEKLLRVVVATEERVFEFRDVNRMGRMRENEKCRFVVYM